MNKEIITGTVTTILLTVVWCILNRNNIDIQFVAIDLPLFFFMYWQIFMIGTPLISQGFRYGIKNSLLKTSAYPALLLGLYYGYVWISGQPLFQGASVFLFYFIFFPVLAFYHRPRNFRTITSIDFLVLVLFLLPITLVKLPERTALPIDGYSFDTMYRLLILVVTAYAFIVIRRLPDVGLRLEYSWKKTGITLWVWMIFIVFIFILGYFMDFIQWGERSAIDLLTIEKWVGRFLSILLHTALFEELFFRGLLQNMLSKKIFQTSSPLQYWWAGGSILVIASLIVGIVMEDGWVWFPFLVSFLLFAVAALLSVLFSGLQHHYLSLAITSVLFGLVHWHGGSVIFVGFAMIGGWAYGYVYYRTKNVFYAALLHALVNMSPMLLGLELMK